MIIRWSNPFIFYSFFEVEVEKETWNEVIKQPRVEIYITILNRKKNHLFFLSFS